MMTPRRRQIPATPWLILLLIGGGSLLVGVAGAFVTQESSSIHIFDNLHWTAGVLIAAVLAWFGVRAAAPESVRGLRWIALGLSAYAAGQIVWDVQALIGYDGFGSPSDLFYLWLGPCVGVGLLIEAFRMADRTQRKTLVLDAAILVIATLTLVLVLYLPRHGALPLLSLAVLVAYPVTLFSAASVGLIAAPTLRLKFSWSYWLFLVSLIVTGVCWMAWNLSALERADLDNQEINSLFTLSIIGMGVGVRFWRMEPSRNALWERVSGVSCACCR